MVDCWKFKPEDRPTFQQCMARIQSMFGEFSVKNKYVSNENSFPELPSSSNQYIVPHHSVFNVQ